MAIYTCRAMDTGMRRMHPRVAGVPGLTLAQGDQYGRPYSIYIVR